MPIIFLFLLMLFFPAVALTQVDPQLVELAKKEGELVAYSSSSTEEVRNMVDGFRKQYPFINASSYRSGDYALLNRVRTEAKAGRYAWDVLDMTTYPGYWLAKVQGYTYPINSAWQHDRKLCNRATLQVLFPFSLSTRRPPFLGSSRIVAGCQTTALGAIPFVAA
jgi:hypothetical protein